MWPYWFMFFIPAWAVLSPARLKPSQAWVPWALIFVLYGLLMGFRHKVGGDWGSYARIFQDASVLPLSQVLSIGDPGYAGLNWLISQAGGNIYFVNLVCAAVMMWGVVVFCRAQPNPWLALLAAVPYMLVVVGMGYTRQSVALGFAMLGLSALGNGRVRSFIIWIAIGATFHKSAVLLLPIAALAASRNRLLNVMLVALISGLLYYLLLADSSERLWENYVTTQSKSQGGLVRIIMNVVPAIVLILFRRRLVPDLQERRLWIWMSLFALVCFPLVGLASTAIDRVALYLIPLQLFVFARFTRLAHSTQVRTPLVLAVVTYYAAVLYIWLNFADHASFWIPYQFVSLG